MVASGDGPRLAREEGAASTLRQRGATVRTFDVWDDPVELIGDDDDELEIRPRALVFEALDRPDLAVAALRAVLELRGWTVRFSASPSIGSMSVRKGRVSDAAHFKPGSNVWLSWQPEDGLLFPQAH